MNNDRCAINFEIFLLDIISCKEAFRILWIELKEFDRLIISVTYVTEKRNFIEFDLRNVSSKNHNETKNACITFRSILCLYFSPIPKLWSRKKVIFKVFVFWRYSKTINKNQLITFHCKLGDWVWFDYMTPVE